MRFLHFANLLLHLKAMSTENTNTKPNTEINLKDVAHDAKQWVENSSPAVKGVLAAAAVKVGKKLAKRHWIVLGTVLGVGLMVKLLKKKR